MNLTRKDVEFIEKLARLLEDKNLAVELKRQPFKHFVLKKNYGEKIHRAFRMTRQGVRWRFNRVFNEVYVSALETILTIERGFGPHLRSQAIEIAQERYLLRSRASQEGMVRRDDRRPKG